MNPSFDVKIKNETTAATSWVSSTWIDAGTNRSAADACYSRPKEVDSFLRTKKVQVKDALVSKSSSDTHNPIKKRRLRDTDIVFDGDDEKTNASGKNSGKSRHSCGDSVNKDCCSSLSSGSDTSYSGSVVRSCCDSDCSGVERGSINDAMPFKKRQKLTTLQRQVASCWMYKEPPDARSDWAKVVVDLPPTSGSYVYEDKYNENTNTTNSKNKNKNEIPSAAEFWASLQKTTLPVSTPQTAVEAKTVSPYPLRNDEEEEEDDDDNDMQVAKLTEKSQAAEKFASRTTSNFNSVTPSPFPRASSTATTICGSASPCLRRPPSTRAQLNIAVAANNSTNAEKAVPMSKKENVGTGEKRQDNAQSRKQRATPIKDAESKQRLPRFTKAVCHHRPNAIKTIAKKPPSPFQQQGHGTNYMQRPSPRRISAFSTSHPTSGQKHHSARPSPDSDVSVASEITQSRKYSHQAELEQSAFNMQKQNVYHHRGYQQQQSTVSSVDAGMISRKDGSQASWTHPAAHIRGVSPGLCLHDHQLPATTHRENRRHHPYPQPATAVNRAMGAAFESHHEKSRQGSPMNIQPQLSVSNVSPSGYQGRPGDRCVNGQSAAVKHAVSSSLQHAHIQHHSLQRLYSPLRSSNSAFKKTLSTTAMAQLQQPSLYPLAKSGNTNVVADAMDIDTATSVIDRASTPHNQVAAKHKPDVRTMSGHPSWWKPRHTSLPARTQSSHLSHRHLCQAQHHRQASLPAISNTLAAPPKLPRNISPFSKWKSLFQNKKM